MQSDDPATSVSISGDGANAEINLSWGPTSCGDSDLVYHNVTFCLSGFGCVKEAVYGGLNYTLTTRDDFPVVFWNSYYANIEAVCGVEQDFILGTKQLYIETGPGGEVSPFSAAIPRSNAWEVVDYSETRLLPILQIFSRWQLFPSFRIIMRSTFPSRGPIVNSKIRLKTSK